MLYNSLDVTIHYLGTIMAKSIKALSLIFFLSFVYARSMEYSMLQQGLFSNAKEKITDTTQTPTNNATPLKLSEQKDEELKDPRLLLTLPNEALGKIIRCIYKDDVCNAIALLIRLSWVSKKFEQSNTPNTIKTVLGLDQRMLDDSLYAYAFAPRQAQDFTPFFKQTRDITPFFKLLISMGANLKKYCKSLIACVLLTTNVYVAEQFITDDIDINQQDEDGHTPLCWAINCNNPTIAKVLLEYKADMYLADNNGDTPTNIALLYGRTECLKVLIEHGVDTAIAYDRGHGGKETIAQWAQMAKNEGIYTLVTQQKMPKEWYEKQPKELLNDTCITS
jgi:hypothetical protein